MGKPSENSSSP